MTGLHHIELWVPDLASAQRSWGWLLTALGWAVGDLGETTFEAQHGDVYLFVEQSPALSGGTHDRRRPSPLVRPYRAQHPTRNTRHPPSTSRASSACGTSGPVSGWEAIPTAAFATPASE